ncbi:MAG: CBS domain-containing protein [Nitrospinae bacterium]|nr:CBS domain-containing protein [Nitrospinota bacterium]
MKIVGDRMRSSIQSIDLNQNINSAAKKIYDNQIGSLLVTEEDKYIGIITKADLMVKVLIKNLDGSTTRVAEIMSKPLITIDVSEPLENAHKLFDEKSIRHLAVSQNDEIIGILSKKDLR